MSFEVTPIPESIRDRMKDCPICQWAFFKDDEFGRPQNQFQVYFDDVGLPGELHLPFYELILLRGSHGSLPDDRYQFLTGEEVFRKKADDICKLYQVNNVEKFPLYGMANQFINKWLQDLSLQYRDS